MNNKTSWGIIGSAVLYVFKIAFSPVNPALSIWEVIKMFVLPIAIGINLQWLFNWYSVLGVAIALFFIAAVRIQMQYLSDDELQAKYDELQELYTAGVVLRNKYLNINLETEGAAKIDGECEDWEAVLFSNIEKWFPRHKSLFRPLMDVPRRLAGKVPANVNLKTYREHYERLERLKIFFKEYRTK